MALSAPALADAPWVSYPLGLVPSTWDGLLYNASAVSLAALPPAVDLSAHLPPIGDQGRQGSCVGWALGYYYKGFQESVERSWSMTDVGHQFSPAYLYNQRNTDDCAGTSGMSLRGGMTILRDKGAASLAAFPYNANDPCTLPSADVMAAAWEYRIVDFAPLFLGAGTADVAVLKALLARGEPFVLSVPVYSGFYRVSASAPVVERPAAGEERRGGHALFVVGYDDARGGFLVVNSWGVDWGVDGRGYLSYEFVQHDATEAWVMTDHVGEGAPQPSEWRTWLPISASSSH
jgi:hypothetical protein